MSEHVLVVDDEPMIRWFAARGIASPCGVLAKPFSPEALAAEVRRCIRSLLA